MFQLLFQNVLKTLGKIEGGQEPQTVSRAADLFPLRVFYSSHSRPQKRKSNGQAWFDAARLARRER